MKKKKQEICELNYVTEESYIMYSNLFQGRKKKNICSTRTGTERGKEFLSGSEDVGFEVWMIYRTSSTEGFLDRVASYIVTQFCPDESSAFSRLDVEELCCWVERS